MSSYGHVGQIEESLRCICEQSHPPTEVIVVDDASTDGSSDMVDALTYRWPMLQQIRCKVNRGPIWRVRLGFYAAHGDFLHFAAADDRVADGYYEKVADVMSGMWVPGIVCGSFTVYGHDGIGNDVKGVGGQRMRPGTWLPGQLADDPLPVQLSGATAVYRRDSYLGVGGYRPELESASDWFLSASIAMKYGLVTIADQGARCFVGPATYSGGKGPEEQEDLKTALDLAMQAPEFEDIRAGLSNYRRLWS